MHEPSAGFAGLVARARCGDRGAIESLVREYEPEVRLVARVRLGAALQPYLDTTDIVHSVHKSLLLGLRNDKFEISTPEQLVALALTLVRRKVARHWRKMQRQQRLDDRPSDRGPLPEVLASLSTPNADPASAAAFRDQVDYLCNQLDGTERRLLELRLDGYSTAEVARLLNLDADVLRVRLSRLRQRLRTSAVVNDWL